METLSDLFALFSAYNKITGHGYSYLKLYSDFSGGLYCYDDTEVIDFDDVPQGCEELLDLIKAIK